MSDETAELVEEAINSLPTALQQALKEVEWRARLETIAGEHQLSPQQQKSFIAEGMMALVGIQSARDLVENLTKEVGVSPGKAKKLANAITDNVLTPVMDAAEKRGMKWGNSETASCDLTDPKMEETMPDYNQELSELHQYIVQEELDLPATIDDMGWILFTDSDLGEMELNLREYNPEFMKLTGVVFSDPKNTRAREDLLRACNTANCELDSSRHLARLTLSEKYNVVRASVAMVLAAEGSMPDEALLRSLIVPMMSSIKAAAKEFTDALQKLDSSPTV